MLRIGGANLVAAALLVAAGFVQGDAHWPLWLAAVAAQWGPALFAHTTGSITIGVDHFTERHGLMIIIVLGESLVSVALAAQEEHVSLALIIGMLCGLAASAAIWWGYFSTGVEADGAALYLLAWRCSGSCSAPARRGCAPPAAWSRWRRFRWGRAWVRRSNWGRSLR